MLQCYQLGRSFSKHLYVPVILLSERHNPQKRIYFFVLSSVIYKRQKTGIFFIQKCFFLRNFITICRVCRMYCSLNGFFTNTQKRIFKFFLQSSLMPSHGAHCDMYAQLDWQKRIKTGLDFRTMLNIFLNLASYNYIELVCSKLLLLWS